MTQALQTVFIYLALPLNLTRWCSLTRFFEPRLAPQPKEQALPSKKPTLRFLVSATHRPVLPFPCHRILVRL